MSICLLDTSVFVEFLNVPNMNTRHAGICDELKQKIRDGEFLFLPLATILETGNHIAQNGNGTQRRKIAVLFVEQVQLALEGKSSFTHTPIRKPCSSGLPNSLISLCGDKDSGTCPSFTTGTECAH